MRLTQEEGGHADICVFPTGENIVLPLGGNTNDRGEKIHIHAWNAGCAGIQSLTEPPKLLSGCVPLGE